MSCDINHGEENVDFVPDPADPESGELVMRVLYPKGSYAGNATNKGGVEFHITDLFEPGSDVTFTYELFFSYNFDFVLGGKLPGLYGGIGKCAGGVHTSTCFSSRFMWRTYGDGEIYVEGRVVLDCPTFRSDGQGPRQCQIKDPELHNLDFVPDPANPDSGELVMRVFYPEGSYAGNQTNKGGINFYIDDLFEPWDSATFTYELYFSDNFPWALGGKLPGLFGGWGSCSGGAGSENTCFSARYMWRRNGDGEIYGYIPNETGDWFCSMPNV